MVGGPEVGWAVGRSGDPVMDNGKVSQMGRVGLEVGQALARSNFTECGVLLRRVKTENVDIARWLVLLLRAVEV